MKVCIVRPTVNVISETFIDAHVSLIPGVSGVVHFQEMIPHLDGAPALSQRLPLRAARKIKRMILREDWENEITRGLTTAFSRCKADVVLAEYGVIAARVSDACRNVRIPLVAHFHGFDASVTSVIEAHAERYRKMFSQAAAVIAVSRAMERRLLDLGCPEHKLVFNPCGVDTARFSGSAPGEAPPKFVSVGRFVEKKAPYLTLIAFRRVLDSCPEATLRMIGDGPLLAICRDLASALGIHHAVQFLGSQTHDVVQRELRGARGFLQHSITASCGDSEGTPVAILEAGATGLPVISTRHAGIPDVVMEGVTGLLVDERDVDGMAEHVLSIARDPFLAQKLGARASQRIRSHYTMAQSISRLQRVLEAVASREDLGVIRKQISAELPPYEHQTQSA